MELGGIWAFTHYSLCIRTCMFKHKPALYAHTCSTTMLPCTLKRTRAHRTPPPRIAPPFKAIECFDSAGAVVVPRSRFAPVKTTSDLFLLRSDAYALTPAATVEAAVPKASWGTAGRVLGGGRQMMNRG